MKRCTKCGNELPATLEYFSSNKRSKDGLHSLCKVCRTERDKQYRQEHIERYRETTKAWKEANREHIDALNKVYAETHKDRKAETNKAWHEKNKVHKNETVKLWAAQNQERRKETIYAWRKKNKESYSAIIKRYKRSHPENGTVCAQRRRARRNSLPSTLTLQQWEQIKTNFDNKCAYCGASGKLTQEHLVAVVSGGGYTADNIIPACFKCNSSKKQKPFRQWYPQQAFFSSDREDVILRAVAGYAVQSG